MVDKENTTLQVVLNVTEIKEIFNKVRSLIDLYGGEELYKTYKKYKAYPACIENPEKKACLDDLVQDTLESFLSGKNIDYVLICDTKIVRLIRDIEAGTVTLHVLNDISEFIRYEKVDLTKEVYAFTTLSKDDGLLLENYITNVAGNVYCFKNIPEEVAAVLLSKVSRSPNTFKANLLEMLKDDDLNVDIVVNHDVFTKTNEKAAKFHEKYTLAYGHASVSEISNIKFGIDKLSILATKELEDNRLGSYIEKSTRYQELDNGSYHIPDELAKDTDTAIGYCSLMDLTFDTYNSLFNPVKEELKVLYPIKEGQKQTPYNNSIHAKACDILRYLLPLSTYTSLGASFNARSMAYLVVKLKSHEIKECNELSDLLKVEGKKICPTLLKYVGLDSTRDDRALISYKLNQGIQAIVKDNDVDNVRLSSNVSYQELLNTLTAYIFYPGSDYSLSQLLSYVKSDLSQNYKIQTIKEFFKARGDFSNIDRAFETINLQSDIVCDYGAFRDLQRHRMASQFKQVLGTELGYSLHPDTDKLSSHIQQNIHNCLSYAKGFHTSLIKYGCSPLVAQYSLNMAWNIRYNFNFDLRELVNIIELRSKKTGHISYRKVAQELYKKLIGLYPVFADLVKVDLNSYTTLERIEEENKKP